MSTNKTPKLKTEKEFNEFVARMMSENKPETIDEAIAQLEKINKLWEESFGENA